MLMAPLARPPGSATELPVPALPPATAAVTGTMKRRSAGSAKIARRSIIIPVIAWITLSPEASRSLLLNCRAAA